MPFTSVLSRRLAVIIIAVIAAVGVLVTGTSRAYAGGNGPGVGVKTHGCPAYTVCVYPQGTGWNNDRPQSSCSFPTNYNVVMDHRWCNFHGMVGVHKVFNNGLYLCTLKNGAVWEYDESAQLNTGANGAGGTSVTLRSGRSIDVNLTPYNSMTLWYFHGEINDSC